MNFNKKINAKVRDETQFIKNSLIKSKQYHNLRLEESGFVKPDNKLEKTYCLTQSSIKNIVDEISSKKIFDLNLDFGPYYHSYTRNGKYLLLGGEMGHISLMDWSNFKLMLETNLQDKIRDICFLSNQNMFAAAQNVYTYIYDNQGIELHCLKKHKSIYSLQYLPFHFILTSIGRPGVLTYSDISTGNLIIQHKTKLGPCKVMKSNPQNAIIHLGHQRGTVTLWSPNVSTSLVTMFCHKGPVTSMDIDLSGNYMVTAGGDFKLKIWDIRNYKKVYSYYAKYSDTNSISISDKNIIAIANDRDITLWGNAFRMKQNKPYMKHKVVGNNVSKLSFCPYEDVLGISHRGGFSSIIIPGSGNPFFDSLENNPYESKNQKREKLVRSLLEKIQPEMISLDPEIIGKINANPIKRDKENNKKDKKIKLKKKGRGKSSSRNKEKRKRDIKNNIKHKEISKEKSKLIKKKKKNTKIAINKRFSALDRFYKK